ncbi:MAG: trehalose 6-phosphate phosphatase [Porticoccaceae bacterium]|nr:MAG: trehalose 6-phosphate phosphatase [Porticoccaceae bacterium]
MDRPPPELDLDRVAFFLDFDGTLVDIAPTPDAVVVPPALPELLAALREASGGALAVVSGRSLAALDRLLGLPLDAAGLHGAEWRLRGERFVAPPGPALAEARAHLAEIARRHGLLLEDKGAGAALHFRDRPELEGLIDRELQARLAGLPGLRLVRGKCVREVLPAGVDKGAAVARFLAQPPFAGRLPVYAGDDLTDEDAFAVLAERGGLTIKVGEGASRAARRLASPAELRAWLAGLASGSLVS